MKGFLKKIWGDSVFSKIIAEIIIWGWGIILWLLYLLFQAIWENTSFKEILNDAWSNLKKFLVIDFTINVFTILLIIIGYLFIAFVIRRILKNRKTKSFRGFTSETFWGIPIKWKWERKNGKWKIKYGDYEKVCPKCNHNMDFDEIDGKYHLKCMNLRCQHRSAVFHYEPPTNSAILGIDLYTVYFHQALESAVDAELRNRGIEKR